MMRRCWVYVGKSRPTFFDILADLEPDMSDEFRRSSFYYNQDNDLADNDIDADAQLSDDAEDDSDSTAAAPSDEALETERLTQPPPPLSSVNQSASRTARNRNVGRLPSELTERLLVAPPGGDRTVLRGDPTGGSGGEACSHMAVDVDGESGSDVVAGVKDSMLRNGHIPTALNFVTTAAAARC